MIRPLPPLIKRYEALGSIVDGRTKIEEGEYRVYSSSGNKYYTVEYDAESNSIMTNDNATFYKGYLGYPALCYLLEEGILNYKPQLAKLVKGIYRKKLNTDMKYDFDAVINHLHETIEADRKSFDEYVNNCEQQLISLQLNQLGKKKKPPTGW